MGADDPDQSTPRVIMAEGKAWVAHDFHQRFVEGMEERHREAVDALTEQRDRARSTMGDMAKSAVDLRAENDELRAELGRRDDALYSIGKIAKAYETRLHSPTSEETDVAGESLAADLARQGNL